MLDGKKAYESDVIIEYESYSNSRHFYLLLLCTFPSCMVRRHFGALPMTTANQKQTPRKFLTDTLSVSVTVNGIS